jgi:putative ABC transport system ATP-binding protein
LLDNISVSIFPGDRISLEGDSGSGKSLFLRSISFLEIINAGEIIWNNRPILATQIPWYRSNVIYLHQQVSLGEGTVEDCLRQIYTVKTHKNKRFSSDAIKVYLEAIGFGTDFLQKDLTRLSGGEAQAVALLRAIQLKPYVLLLDEPTAALDETKTIAVEAIVNLWLKEVPESRAYVWVTHNKKQAARVSNKTWLMEHGKLCLL